MTEILCVLSGISVLYFMLLLFVLFQRLSDVQEMVYWLYPDLRHYHYIEKVTSPPRYLIGSQSTLPV